MQVMAGAREGGAEEFFVRLCGALGRAGLEQRVLIRRHPERAGRLREGGLDVAELPFGGPLDLATPRRLKREIGAWKPDVVLTWMSRASRRCPGGDFVQVGRLGGYYPLRNFAGCRHLVANTRDLVAHIAACGWPEERVHYLPNFADSVPAEPLDRAMHATPADAPLLLALGRLHANKAFDVMLRALAALPGAFLWIAGEGPERAALEQEMRRLGIADRVRLLGWRRDVPALLATADLLVCPSRHEPLGNVVLEGWAHGRPVVAAASRGPAELIRDAADGLLVPVDDADALAAAIRRIMADRALAGALAAAGRARFEAEFAEPGVVARYMEFFERAATDRPAGSGIA